MAGLDRIPDWPWPRINALLDRHPPTFRAEVAGRLEENAEAAWSCLARECERETEERRRDPALYDEWPPRRPERHLTVVRSGSGALVGRDAA